MAESPKDSLSQLICRECLHTKYTNHAAQTNTLLSLQISAGGTLESLALGQLDPVGVSLGQTWFFDFGEANDLQPQRILQVTSPARGYAERFHAASGE